MSSRNRVLDGSLDGDLFFRSCSWQALHSFTNFLNNVVMNVAYWIVQCIINSFNAYSYPSCLLWLHVNTFYRMFVVFRFWHLCFKQEDHSIEWMIKGWAMVLRINVLWYNGFVFSQHLPFLWEKTGLPHLALVCLTAGWLADEMQLDFEIFTILYRLNYLDFYFLISVHVINSVRGAFQSAFLK